jgi:type I restriction enzyme S subunit
LGGDGAVKWEIKKLADCCVSITDGDHQPPPKAQKGIPFVTISNITTANQFDFTNTMYVSEEYYNHLDSKRKPQRGDILYSVVGSFGIPVYIKETIPFVFQRHIAVLRPNHTILPQFLYYTMLNRDFYLMADAAAIGAAQRTVSLSALRNMKIAVPPINIQEKIVYLLSAYDNLIENNQKQIKLLEEAAQRLYKEWFVDLRFPGYETTPVVDGVPEGWELCRVGDVIEFNPKVPLNKERLKESVPMSALSTTSMVLDVDEFTTTFSNSGSKFQNDDTLLARITPCLENGKTAFVAGIESDEGAVGSTEFIVMRSKGINPYMVYLLARNDSFRQSAINSMTGSDGRQRAQADKLKVLPYLKPTDQIMMLFARYVELMFIQIQKKNEQNVRLRQARDRLLPKLMSGEVEV